MKVYNTLQIQSIYNCVLYQIYFNHQQKLQDCKQWVSKYIQSILATYNKLGTKSYKRHKKNKEI